jgi:hypothetical protein
MKNLKLVLCAGAASMGLAFAGAAGAQTAPAPAAAAPAPSPAPNPAMSATLSANPYPATFDAGPLGKLTVTGVLSGGGFYTSDPVNNVFSRPTQTGYGDITNALAMVQKTDGVLQFFVAGGAYSLAALGSTYYTSSQQERLTFGFVPEGFVKIVPNANFSIEAGVLPTLVGDEYTFSFQNMNIQRGLLWNQENIFTRGIQLNYTNGPWAVSASWNDGYYSNTFNTVSGLITYTFKNSDALTFAASAATGAVDSFSLRNQVVTPIFQANSQIYNLIYTHSHGPWTISPYFQYTNVPSNKATQLGAIFLGLSGNGAGSTVGGALLVKYSITPAFSLALRGEYITSSGSANLLYGPDSNAWSITFTPTYQKGIFFIRGEVSYVSIGNGTFGDGFGPHGINTDQVRAAGEGGIMF